ncbi:MAG TPA: metallophosphoesterase [Patescibacteria group bacterium]|nr:metallophosphoesterase [Patescibacteria group bacterium]
MGVYTYHGIKIIMKIAALGDIHVKENSQGLYTALFEKISSSADVLLLAGDLCDLGLPTEAKVLASEFKSLRIPVVGVLGNHDYQSGKEEEVKKILTEGGMKVLGTEPFEMDGVGFAGVKGFCGGYEKYSLGSFGEKLYKDLVQMTLDESLALENQIKQIESEKKVAIMHYSPVRDTLEGEPLEIYPFLGSSRFIDPIDNLNVNLVFHGHAHHGSHLGRTPKGIPVYNVSYPIMQNINPDQPFAVVEL